MRQHVPLPFLLSVFSLLSIVVPGCGGGGEDGHRKKSSASGLSAPTWLKVDPSKFLPLEGPDINKDVDRDADGEPRIRVFDPKGWKL